MLTDSVKTTGEPAVIVPLGAESETVGCGVTLMVTDADDCPEVEVVVDVDPLELPEPPTLAVTVA